MVKHITINGQTYASVEDMPPEIRQQYEAAMQILATNAPAGIGKVSTGDVSISSEGSDPAHHIFKTVTKVTSSRFVVNGKEYSHWDDVPPEARAALETAGVGARPLATGTHHSLPANLSQIQSGCLIEPASLNSSSSVTVGLGTLAVLLLAAILAGIFIAYKFMH
jgi:hypothetical protein